MHRPKPLIVIGPLAAFLAVLPILGAVVLAADPVVVQPGDTLTAISARHGVSIERIVELNALPDPNRIYVGQRLRLQPATPEPAADAGRVTHVVRRGESLWGIARHYGSSVAAIAQANGIADPSRIFGGQRLVIPGAAAAAAEPTPAALPADIAAAVAARAEVRQLIAAEAKAQGVPVALALAVAWQESGWRQGVVSYAGAVGIMQLLPTTADWVATSMLGAPVDVHDAEDNVRAGIRLLRHYLDRYGADSDLVLAAYYQGQRATDTHGVYGITRPYIASIRALERLFGG